MKCERVAELLPDYLQGGLGHDLDDQVEDHLEQCAHCAAEVALWKDLATLPVEQPSPALRSRFHAMLSAYGEGRGEKAQPEARRESHGILAGWLAGSWLRPASVAFAGALAMLAIGFFAGRSTVVPVNPPQNSNQVAQLTEMRDELTNMRQLVVLSMLQEQSATERMQGVSWSTQDTQSDPKILSALLHTLRYDTNVDVRLAALDALSRHGNQAEVRSGLLEALPTQQSPLVQVAMIDLMVELHDTNAIPQLKKFEGDNDLNPSVRERATWAIQHLNS
jgi:anti-sigma factor RsiW